MIASDNISKVFAGKGGRRQPGFVAGRSQDHRHPVVYLGDVPRCRRRQYAKRRQGRAAVGRLPLLPQPRKGQYVLMRVTEKPGLPVSLGAAPFEKPVGGNDASTLLQCVPETGFVSCRFGPGIDEPVSDGAVLGPERNEAPPHRAERAPPRIRRYHGGRHPRRGVVAGRQRHRSLAGTESIRNGFDVAELRKPSTHLGLSEGSTVAGAGAARGDDSRAKGGEGINHDIHEDHGKNTVQPTA
jgi:hypothetical protein